jgi:hypothetical protein
MDFFYLCSHAFICLVFLVDGFPSQPFLFTWFFLCGYDIGAESPTSLRPLNSIASSNLHGNGHAPSTHTSVAPIRTYANLLWQNVGNFLWWKV